MGADFASDDGHAGFDEGFDGDAGVGVFGEDGVEDGVGDLIGHFVGVAFRDRFGGEGGVLGHGGWVLGVGF